MKFRVCPPKAPKGFSNDSFKNTHLAYKFFFTQINTQLLKAHPSNWS